MQRWSNFSRLERSGGRRHSSADDYRANDRGFVVKDDLVIIGYKSKSGRPIPPRVTVTRTCALHHALNSTAAVGTIYLLVPPQDG